jgi:hypothetical protein
MNCLMVSATTAHVTVNSRSQRDLSSAENLRQTLRSTAWGMGFADLAVGIEHGAVHLSGSVPSYHLKQMAQTLAARQSDGLQVVNSLVVRSGW